MHKATFALAALVAACSSAPMRPERDRIVEIAAPYCDGGLLRDLTVLVTSDEREFIGDGDFCPPTPEGCAKRPDCPRGCAYGYFEPYGNGRAPRIVLWRESVDDKLLAHEAGHFVAQCLTGDPRTHP